MDVTVEIKSCPTFDGTVEFGLHIDEHSVENASVGKYLFASCVKIIDRSAFPSDGLRVINTTFVRGDDVDNDRQFDNISPPLARILWPVAIPRK